MDSLALPEVIDLADGARMEVRSTDIADAGTRSKGGRAAEGGADG